MDKFTARRKLLRGSLAAPVVLTVASPANLAAASTTCLARTDQTNLPQAFVVEKDVYLRRTIQVCKVTKGKKKGNYAYLDKTGSTWYSVDDGSDVKANHVDTSDCRNLEVLVYVDSRGYETGYGHLSTSNGGSFTSMGCWNSLMHA